MYGTITDFSSNLTIDCSYGATEACRAGIQCCCKSMRTLKHPPSRQKPQLHMGPVRRRGRPPIRAYLVGSDYLAHPQPMGSRPVSRPVAREVRADDRAANGNKKGEGWGWGGVVWNCSEAHFRLIPPVSWRFLSQDAIPRYNAVSVASLQQEFAWASKIGIAVAQRNRPTRVEAECLGAVVMDIVRESRFILAGPDLKVRGTRYSRRYIWGRYRR